VAVDGALGDEQARPDLLVGQAVGDQLRDLGFAFAERPGAGLAGGRAGSSLRWLAERERRCLIPVQALSGLELGGEPRCPERRGGRLPGPGQQWNMERHDVGANFGPHCFRGPEQPRREPRLARQGGVAAERVQQVVQRHPVIHLVSDPQRLGEQRL